MHHTRLVGGLISVAALLTLLLVPSALLAADPPPPAPAGPAPGAAVSPTSAFIATFPVAEPQPTKAQRQALRIRRQRAKLLSVARRQLGVPYAYGGSSPGGFDCSGFTMYVYARLGVSLSHGATDQAHRGRPVSLRHLQPGDLVFFGGSGYYHHVGLYAGHGRMIHAPHTGAVVSYEALRGAATARRLIGS